MIIAYYFGALLVWNDVTMCYVHASYTVGGHMPEGDTFPLVILTSYHTNLERGIETDGLQSA